MSLRPYGHHRHRVTANLSDEQFQSLKGWADHYEMRTSSLLRDAAFAYFQKQPLSTKAQEEIRVNVLRQLSGIATNINQMAHYAHQTRSFRDADFHALQQHVAMLMQLYHRGHRLE